jgi:hypothetical protein
MLRYFVAGNLWLVVVFYSLLERLRGRMIGDATTFPAIFAAFFFVLYCLTTPPASFRFSIRSLLMAVTMLALLLGAVVMAQYYQR